MTDTTGEIRVSAVPTEYVQQIWPQVEPLVQKAVKYTYGRHNTTDILDLLLNYDHALWIAFNEDKILGAGITSFIQYPQAKYLNFLFCGGEKLKAWKDPMLALLRRWAKDNHCDGIEGTARIGWANIFKRDGYKPVWHTYQLPLDNGDEGTTDGQGQ